MEALFEKDVKLVMGGGKEAASMPTKGVVGLYFSAHWCGPCRHFTPRLIENYKKIRDNGKEFEVIFVSSDRDEKAFQEYHAEMPWPALSFDHRDIKEKLSKKFKVRGIPSLVLLDAETGKVITTDGRTALTKDSEGKDYPWKPKPALELIGDKLVKADGATVSTTEAIKDKYVLIYFSAHWCPPCKAFTPKFAETYKKLIADGKNVEVIFASNDNDDDEFESYFKTQPWLAIPYENRDAVDQLSSLFEVEGIPTLVMLGPDGQLISKEARDDVSNDPEGNDFPWLPNPVCDIDRVVERLNDTTCLVALAEGVAEAEQKEIEAALLPVALEAKAKADEQEEDLEIVCAIASKQPGTIAKRVRELCKLGSPSDKATLMILDLSDKGSYYTWDGDGKIDASVVQDFVKKFRNMELEKKSLERGR